ncbi:MAG TPA: hypothetical protein VHY22_10605 [Chthoniobacteraceae bacterium]|nr:hypothetical protein [Chthoniobacteraceae bacterium]
MIPRFLIPLIIASLGLCFFTPSHACAKDKKPKASATPFHIVIESISADSITIKRPSGDVTFKIGPNTEITYKGDTVTASQLQAGMRVQVTPDDIDPTVAGMISADEAPHSSGESK